MKPALFLSASLLIVILFTGCSDYNVEQTETIPVEYTMGIDVNGYSPELKSGGATGWGSFQFIPGENPDVKANDGKILNIRVRQIIWSSTGLAAPTAISEGRVKYRVPRPGAGPGDPISDRWITTGWSVNNSSLQDGIDYALFPGTEWAGGKDLSTMLFANDTIGVEWECWHDEFPNAYRINIKVLADMEISR